jgi:phosphoglycerate kinase
MALKNLTECIWLGKTALLRCDFNVPLKDGIIQDTTRIDLALPTIEYLIKSGISKLVMMSHLGRPTHGKFDKAFSLEPVAKYLADKLRSDVILTSSAIDPGLKNLLKMPETRFVLLENLRFHEGEEKDDPEFARHLSTYAECYINDAFGAAHRKHASIHQIVRFFPDKSFPGLLLNKEVEALSYLLEYPKRPFVALMGGAKIADKLKVIEGLLVHVDHLLIGGAMAYPFLKVKGCEVGRSYFVESDLECARKILALPSAVKIHLPVDHILGQSLDQKEGEPIGEYHVPNDRMALDIGHKTVQDYRRCLLQAQTVFWNGPMGLFENPAFAQGTFAMAKAISEGHSYSVVGGGDSVAAVNQTGLQKHFTHISTGGGASLEFLEHATLPGIKVLKFGLS